MPNAFILSACRTPIGKFRGSLSWLPAVELGAIAVREAVSRAGVEPAAIEEVIFGNVLSAGVGQAPARQAALRAGLPPTGGRANGEQGLWVWVESRVARGPGRALRRRRSGRRRRNGEHEPGRLGAAARCAARRRPPADRFDDARRPHVPVQQEVDGRNRRRARHEGRHLARRAGSVRTGKPSPGGCRDRGGRVRRGNRSGSQPACVG